MSLVVLVPLSQIPSSQFHLGRGLQVVQSVGGPVGWMWLRGLHGENPAGVLGEWQGG